MEREKILWNFGGENEKERFGRGLLGVEMSNFFLAKAGCIAHLGGVQNLMSKYFVNSLRGVLQTFSTQILVPFWFFENNNLLFKCIFGGGNQSVDFFCF